MIWLIWPIIVAAFAYEEFFTGYHTPESGFEYIMAGVMIVMMTAAFGLLPAAGAAALVGMLFKTEPVKVGIDTLVALRNTSGVAGTFFLGTGTIGTDLYYFYYSAREDGGFTPGKIRAGDGVRIYEEDRSDAILTSWKWKHTEGWAWLVAIPMRSEAWSYEFRVPKGTIKTGYAL